LIPETRLFTILRCYEEVGTGGEGILIPSARVPGGINLVYFPKSLSKLSKVQILGREELDQWLKTK